MFTDGSSVTHEDIEPVPGFGAYFGRPLDFSDFVPIKEQQSNNRAELRALLICLHLVLTQDDHLCWAFAIDSKYVVDGAAGGAARWMDSNRVTRACKLASHVDLWREILPLLDTLGHRVTGFHVFSHIHLHGNDRADTLANEGRASSPLFSYLLPGARPNKRRHIDVQDVAELVMSSDEELDTIYLAAKSNYLLSGATMHLSPKLHRSHTPDPSSPFDFACGTPDPPDFQYFFSGVDAATLALSPPVVAPWLTETSASTPGVFWSWFSPLSTPTYLPLLPFHGCFRVRTRPPPCPQAVCLGLVRLTSVTRWALLERITSVVQVV